MPEYAITVYKGGRGSFEIKDLDEISGRHFSMKLLVSEPLQLHDLLWDTESMIAENSERMMEIVEVKDMDGEFQEIVCRRADGELLSPKFKRFKIGDVLIQIGRVNKV